MGEPVELRDEAGADVDAGSGENSAVGGDGEPEVVVAFGAWPLREFRRASAGRGPVAISTRDFCRAWLTSTRSKTVRSTSFMVGVMCLIRPPVTTLTCGDACGDDCGHLGEPVKGPRQPQQYDVGAGE